MKKFLFTLVALLMAGSAVADDYFYMDDFEVPQSALGATGTAARINVNVKAHFDGYVSAWECQMTLPAGLTVQGVRAGSDLTLSYLDEFGDDATVTPTLNKNLTSDPIKVIVAQLEGGYDEDGNLYGPVKWEPGDYNQMWIFVFNATADFQGGEISLSTKPGCGSDTRPEVLENKTNGVQTTHTTTVTVEGATPEPQDCAAPVITYETQADKVVVTVTWNESDGNKVYTGQYEYARPEYGQPDESYNVEAYTEATENYNESPHATETIPVPAKDPVWQAVDAPVISYETQTDKVVVTITWPETTGSQVYTGQYEYTRPEAGEADQSYDVEAYTTADYPYMESTHATATIPVPAKEPVVLPTLQGELVFSEVNQEDGTFTVTYNGNEEGVTVTITDYALRAGADGQLPNYGTYNVTAVAKKDGYQDLEKTEPLTWNAPQEKTADPSVYAVSGNKCYTITIENNASEPNAVIYVSIDGGEYQVYTGPIVIDEMGDHTVSAYAQTEGKAPSNPVSTGFTIDENTQPDPTAVNELNGEKAVAGVRYFNMAGQEMQEANGVTIVVTTYTDGTTSAVKVIK